MRPRNHKVDPNFLPLLSGVEHSVVQVISRDGLDQFARDGRFTFPGRVGASLQQPQSVFVKPDGAVTALPSVSSARMAQADASLRTAHLEGGEFTAKPHGDVPRPQAAFYQLRDGGENLLRENCPSHEIDLSSVRFLLLPWRTAGPVPLATVRCTLLHECRMNVARPTL